MENIIERTRRKDITFYKSGRIDITARVARILNLKQGDSINISKDENGEFLLFAQHNQFGRHCAKVYKTCCKGLNFRANSKKLYWSLVSICEVKTTAEKVSFFCGEQTNINNITYLPIITKLPIYE